MWHVAEIWAEARLVEHELELQRVDRLARRGALDLLYPNPFAWPRRLRRRGRPVEAPVAAEARRARLSRPCRRGKRVTGRLREARGGAAGRMSAHGHEGTSVDSERRSVAGESRRS